MTSEDQNPLEEIKRLGKRRKERIVKLNHFHSNYTCKEFLDDLQAYFDNEIDFDLKRISNFVSKKGVLGYLCESARKNDTHPVVEFLHEIFKDSLD